MTVRKPDPSELDLTDVEWTTSSHSGGGGNCVQVGRKGPWVLVADSNNPETRPLVYTIPEVQAWIRGAKDGEFDSLVDLS